MQDSHLEVSRYLFASRLNAHSQTDWTIADQAKKLELNSPSLWWESIQPTWLHFWLSHLALAIYLFVVVNFDALAQASVIRIKRRQVVFLCVSRVCKQYPDNSLSPDRHQALIWTNIGLLPIGWCLRKNLSKIGNNILWFSSRKRHMRISAR